MRLSARLAQPSDASDITRLFNQQYDTYFGKFSNDEQLCSSLDDMHRAIDDGEQPWGAVYVLEAEDGVVGASALKNNRPGWCEYSSTVIAPEARGGNGYSQLHAKRREAHDSYYPDRELHGKEPEWEPQRGLFTCWIQRRTVLRGE